MKREEAVRLPPPATMSALSREDKAKCLKNLKKYAPIILRSESVEEVLLLCDSMIEDVWAWTRKDES